MCQCHDVYDDQPATATCRHPVTDVAGDQCHDHHQTAPACPHSPNKEKSELLSSLEPASV